MEPEPTTCMRCGRTLGPDDYPALYIGELTSDITHIDLCEEHAEELDNLVENYISHRTRNSSAINPNIISIGQYYMEPGTVRDPVLYFLARPTHYKAVLVNTKTGNRWVDPVTVTNPRNITTQEWSRIVGSHYDAHEWKLQAVTFNSNAEDST